MPRRCAAGRRGVRAVTAAWFAPTWSVPAWSVPAWFAPTWLVPAWLAPAWLVAHPWWDLSPGRCASNHPDGPGQGYSITSTAWVPSARAR